MAPLTRGGNGDHGDMAQDSPYPGLTPVDDFGVPVHLLGPHPEEMFNVVARIIMLSALLEDLQRTLLQTLEEVGETEHATTRGSAVVELLRKQAAGAQRFRPEWAELNDVLDRTADLLDFRNGVAHNLWPAQPGGNRVFGHRLVAKSKKRECFEYTPAEMRAVTGLVRAIEDTQKWRARAPEIVYLRKHG